MKTFMEDFEKATHKVSPTNTIREIRKTLKKAKALRDSYSNGKMKKSNPLLYLLIGGLVGKKHELGRAARILIRAGIALGILQLIALLVVWIVSLFL